MEETADKYGNRFRGPCQIVIRAKKKVKEGKMEGVGRG